MGDAIYLLIYTYAIVFLTFRANLNLGLTLVAGWTLPPVAMWVVDKVAERNVELNIIALCGTCAAYLAWLWLRESRASGGSRMIDEDPYGGGGGGGE